MGQNEQIITLVYETKWIDNAKVYETKWTDNDNSIWDKMNR